MNETTNHKTDDEKDRILDAVLPHVLFDGWTQRALERAAGDIDLTYEDIQRIFPAGIADVIGYFVRRADRRMTDELERRNIAAMRIRDRITTAVRVRLEQNEPCKEAIRRALNVQMLPQNAGTAMTQLYGTVDAMWYAARDLSTDFNFYSKRMILAAVYSSTLLYWLDDTSEGHHRTWEFLDRRIENVMSFEKTKARFKKAAERKPNFSRLPSARLFFRNLQTGRHA